MRRRGAPLALYSNAWQLLQQRRVPPPLPNATATPPQGDTLRIAGAARYRFVCQGARVTGNYYDTCPDVQHEFETAPSPTHDATLAVRPLPSTARR